MDRYLPVIIIALAIGALPLRGQSPVALEMDKAGAVWFNSSNAAGMTATPTASFTTIDAGYHIANGEYRKYTDGNERNLDISVEGAAPLWRGQVWGKFTYSNITQRDTRYNTLFLNLDEDNPFFVADQELSWWKKQKYELEMKASTPFYWDRLAFGIEAEYFAESGAKQIDPRGYGSEYGILVKPAALLKLGKSYIGLALDYEKGNMRMTPINNAYMNSKAAYILHGLGNNEADVISLLTTGIGQVFDKKNQYGASLQYGFVSDSFKFLADIYGNMRSWDFSHTPNRPEAIGSTKRTDLGGKVQVISESDRFLHRLVASGSMKNTDGIEYVQVFNKDYNVQAYETVAENIKSKYSHTEAELSYDFVRKGHDSYNWAVGADVDYYSRNDRYLIPESNFKCAQLFAGVRGKKQFFLKKISMILGADAGYCMAFDSEYNYQGTSAGTPIVTDYFPHELAYRSASYFSAGLNYEISFKLSERNTLSAGIRAKMLRTDNELMKSRNIADVTVGFIF